MSNLGRGPGHNCAGSLTGSADVGYNLDSGTSCGFSSAHHSLSNTDPKLVPLANNGGLAQTMALPPGSPAINAGGTSANGCPTTDQRGVSRPQGPACDIGAYEFVPTTSTTVSANPNPGVYQQSVQLCASVKPASGTPGMPIGSATFKDGTTTLSTDQLNSSGAACFSTAALAVGDHSITAAYSGDASFNPSTSAALSLTIGANGQDVMGTSADSGTGAPTNANGAATGSSQANVSSQQNPAATSAHAASLTKRAPTSANVPGLATGAGIVLVLLGLGGLGAVLYRARRVARG